MRIKWPIWYKILAIIFGVVFFVYHYERNSDAVAEEFGNIINLEIKGVILNKFFDSKNHLSKTCLILEERDTCVLILNFDESGLFDQISVGDSIFKSEGDSLVILKRNSENMNYILRF